MPQISFPGEVLAMTGQAADRLLKLDNGDAALLYLHLLRHGAQTGLRWPEDRLEAAWRALLQQGLAPERTAPAASPVQEPPPPEYGAEEIN